MTNCKHPPRSIYTPADPTHSAWYLFPLIVVILSSSWGAPLSCRCHHRNNNNPIILCRLFKESRRRHCHLLHFHPLPPTTAKVFIVAIVVVFIVAVVNKYILFPLCLTQQYTETCSRRVAFVVPSSLLPPLPSLLPSSPLLLLSSHCQRCAPNIYLLSLGVTQQYTNTCMRRVAAVIIIVS